MEKERFVDDSILEDQFDEFLSRLEIMESEEFNGMEDDDFDAPAKERVLMIKLDKAAFDPLLSAMKTTRPALYQALLQHSLVSGQQKSNRKQSRKEKKRDRKHERDRERERVLRERVALPLAPPVPRSTSGLAVRPAEPATHPG